MPDREKVIKGLECCMVTDDDAPCTDCPYNDPTTYEYGENHCLRKELMPEAISLLKELERQLEEYHKADTFLAAHGWEWEGR